MMQKVFCLIENIFAFIYLSYHELKNDPLLLLNISEHTLAAGLSTQSKGRSPTQNAQTCHTTGNTVKVLSFKF